jgi:hypothetical protein
VAEPPEAAKKNNLTEKEKIAENIRLYLFKTGSGWLIIALQ